MDRHRRNFEASIRNALSSATTASVVLATAVRLAGAQTATSSSTLESAPGFVRLYVIDELGRPIPDVGVDFRSRPGGPPISASTDSSGRQTVRLTIPPSQYEYVVRRIGYGELSGSVALNARDSVELTVKLTRLARQLDAVRTSARENRQSYSISAEQIARSGRHDIDVYNVLHGLRPNMFGDRMRNCPYTRNFWVNGRRIPLAPWEAVVPLQSRRVQVPMPHSPPNSPLTMIKPEHIAEIHYVNCLDRSVPNTPYYHDALFVTLKAGIGFDLKRGSYVADSSVARAAGVIP